MKMFVSRYALSEGIKEVEGDLSRYTAGYFRPAKGSNVLKIGTDCHPTRDEAVAAAEAMRAKKITSLRKQIAKLEKLTFGEA